MNRSLIRRNPVCLLFAFLWPFVASLPACSPSKSAAPAAAAPAVTVARPVQREVIEWDEYLGRLEAVESVEVRARVNGLIVATPFQEGALVKTGDIIAEIDVRPFQAELDSRQADLARAIAALDIAKIEERRVQSIPNEAAAPIEYENAAATVRQNEAQVAAAKANVQSAQLNVEWCRVVAPIDGRISRKLVTPGNLITGGGSQATLLTTITSIDPIYCYLDADERSVLKYQRLSREKKRVSARDTPIPCFLQLADEKGFKHEGMIDFVDNRMDSWTGTLRGRGVFPNPNGWLTPGYFARIRIPGSGRYVATLVPNSAVSADMNQKIVYVVNDAGAVEVRPITLGAVFGKYRGIESGLTTSDRVVIAGLLQVRPGQKVNATEAPLTLDDFELTSPGSPTTQALPLKFAESAPASNPSSASRPRSNP